MSEPRHLTNAPIREAVIDIQVTSPISLDALKEIATRLKDKPHKQDELWQSSIEFQINADGKGGANTNSDRSPLGYRYTFSNHPYVLQCQVRGFTFSHLPPYGNWEEMSAIAKELWEIYLEIAKPQSVSRIAVRYINSLPIPLPITDFAEYLNVPPIVPEGLPQSLASFLQRFVMVESSTGTVAVVTQVLEEITQTSKATILLDVDASKTYHLGFASNTAFIWAELEELHNFKNRVFFKYLTEKTIRMFE
jgi:uncharacterized protein (TIGR04255 family)